MITMILGFCGCCAAAGMLTTVTVASIPNRASQTVLVILTLRFLLVGRPRRAGSLGPTAIARQLDGVNVLGEKDVFCDIRRGRFEIALGAAVIDLYQGTPSKVPQVRKNAMLQTVFTTGAGRPAEPRLVAHLKARPLTAATTSYVRGHTPPAAAAAADVFIWNKRTGPAARLQTASYMALLFAVPVSPSGLAVAESKEFPRWLGWVGVTGRIGSIVGGLLSAYTGFSTTERTVAMPFNLDRRGPVATKIAIRRTPARALRLMTVE
jgi:hypothetical protein